jgi:hypothetical protein
MGANTLPEWLMDYVRATNKRKRNAEAVLPGERQVRAHSWVMPED